MTTKHDIERRLDGLEPDEEGEPGIIEILSEEYNKDRESEQETEDDDADGDEP